MLFPNPVGKTASSHLSPRSKPIIAVSCSSFKTISLAALYLRARIFNVDNPSLTLPLPCSFAIYAAKILSIQELPSRSLGILPKRLIDVPSVPIQSERPVRQRTDFPKKQPIRAGGFSHFSSPGLSRLRRSFSARFAPIKPPSYAGYAFMFSFTVLSL